VTIQLVVGNKRAPAIRGQNNFHGGFSYKAKDVEIVRELEKLNLSPDQGAVKKIQSHDRSFYLNMRNSKLQINILTLKS
jgi:hypothetical protein